MLKNKLTITAAAIALVMLATACTTKPNSSLHNSFDYENALDRNPGFKKYLAKDKGDRISRELTLSYYADERRSAAISRIRALNNKDHINTLCVDDTIIERAR